MNCLIKCFEVPKEVKEMCLGECCLSRDRRNVPLTPGGEGDVTNTFMKGW